MMVRHAIFNFNEKHSLSEDWDLGIFDCSLRKRYFLLLGMGPIFGPKYWQTRALGSQLEISNFLYISLLKIVFIFANSADPVGTWKF